MATCNTCGWTGDPDDCRDVPPVDPGLCPDCLSTDVDVDDQDGVDAGDHRATPGGDA